MSAPSTLRVDAARNRERLLAAAISVFASADTDPSMRAIAREAGVGIATLLRHFPTREALVEAIYQEQAQRLTTGARDLLERYPPAEAMRRWMDLFADWLATKRGMLGNLRTTTNHAEPRHPRSRGEMLAAIAAILDAGRAAGDIRGDVDAEDVSAHLVGIFTVAGTPAEHPRAAHLLDQVMDGLRPQRN
jgi:AcrR family transcriptional regulator